MCRFLFCFIGSLFFFAMLPCCCTLFRSVFVFTCFDGRTMVVLHAVNNFAVHLNHIKRFSLLFSVVFDVAVVVICTQSSIGIASENERQCTMYLPHWNKHCFQPLYAPVFTVLAHRVRLFNGVFHIFILLFLSLTMPCRFFRFLCAPIYLLYIHNTMCIIYIFMNLSLKKNKIIALHKSNLLIDELLIADSLTAIQMSIWCVRGMHWSKYLKKFVSFISFAIIWADFGQPFRIFRSNFPVHNLKAIDRT